MFRVVYWKELIDSLRDRRALISMIVLPLVVMPLLVIGMGGLSLKIAERARIEVHEVMVLGGEAAPELVEKIENLDTLRLVSPEADFRQRVADKKIQAVLEVPEDFASRVEAQASAELKIYNYEGETRSNAAAGRLEALLRDERSAVVRERLEAEGLTEALLSPFDVTRENVAPPERVTGVIIGGLLPYILIMLCITGAIYPAMDLTAGEKERGTMETLLSSPVPRLTLVLGKFAVVFTFSITTALLALCALGGMFWLAVSRMEATGVFLELSLSPLAIGGFFLLLTPMAALFSALLLALSLFARTFREAQTYVSPLMIVALLPAVVALMPGVELTPLLALVPVLNVSLIGREILSGFHPWGYIVLIFASSSLYAAAALWGAVKLFQQESVVFRE